MCGLGMPFLAVSTKLPVAAVHTAVDPVAVILRTLHLHAEEPLQPEKVPQETVVPQRNQHVAQPRPAPSKRAPAPAQQLPAARYLNLQHGSRDGPPTNGGPRSPPRNTEDMHDHLSSLHMQEEEPWQDIDPEMVRTAVQHSAASSYALEQPTCNACRSECTVSRATQDL